MAVRAAAGPRPLRATRRRYGELLVKGLLGICALISVATTVGIVLALFLPAIEFFQDVNPIDFLTGTEWAPLFEPAHYGVVPNVLTCGLEKDDPRLVKSRLRYGQDSSLTNSAPTPARVHAEQTS